MIKDNIYMTCTFLYNVPTQNFGLTSLFRFMLFKLKWTKKHMQQFTKTTKLLSDEIVCVAYGDSWHLFVVKTQTPQF